MYRKKYSLCWKTFYRVFYSNSKIIKRKENVPRGSFNLTTIKVYLINAHYIAQVINRSREQFRHTFIPISLEISHDGSARRVFQEIVEAGHYGEATEGDCGNSSQYSIYFIFNDGLNTPNNRPRWNIGYFARWHRPGSLPWGCRGRILCVVIDVIGSFVWYWMMV